jgi:hypothetical protein
LSRKHGRDSTAEQFQEPGTDVIEYIGPGTEAVKPFIAPTQANAAVPMTESVALPLSLYKVSLKKSGFNLEKDIKAADAAEAQAKFYAMHGIVKCERPPEVTLIQGPAA